MSDRVPLSEAVDKDESAPVQEPVPVTAQEEHVGYIGQPEYHKTADFFELDFTDRRDNEMAGKMSTIYDWAVKRTGSNEVAEVLTMVKSLKSTLGLNEVGRGLVNKLYRWVRLDQSQRGLQKEKDLIRQSE